MASDPESDPKQARDQSDFQSHPTNIEADPGVNHQQAEITLNINPTTETTQTHTPPAASRPIKLVYQDFSLLSGSASEVRFRTRHVSRYFKVYDQPNAQLILEEIEESVEDDGGDGNMERDVAQDRNQEIWIRIRHTYDTSYGLQFLR